MLLGKPFAQFVEESPISVMMRGIVEYAFDANRLDEVFEETAEAQYTRELRFSTVADLMSEVVFNISPSIGAAYQANVGQMTVKCPKPWSSRWRYRRELQVGSMLQAIQVECRASASTRRSASIVAQS